MADIRDHHLIGNMAVRKRNDDILDAIACDRRPVGGLKLSRRGSGCSLSECGSYDTEDGASVY